MIYSTLWLLGRYRTRGDWDGWLEGDGRAERRAFFFWLVIGAKYMNLQNASDVSAVKTIQDNLILSID